MKKKSLTLRNGEQYFYLDEGQGNETFVLLHGNMSSSVHYKPIIERLKNDYRIIAPDMRGFGDSTYKKPINTLHDLGNDVIDFLRILGIKKYYLVGWSTGGAIAMSIASQKPDEVKKLILIESCSYRGYPIFKKDENMQPLIGEYYTSKEDLATDMVQVQPMVQIFESNNVSIMKSIWDQAIYTVHKPNPSENDMYLRETMKQRNLVDIDWCLTTFNMSNFTNGVSLGDGTINQVICPVLSIWSDKDITVLEYMVDETVEALQDATKVVLKDSGHSPLVDKPKELVDSIKHFIS